MAKSFVSFGEKEQGSVLIVDGLNLAFRWKHMNKKDFANNYVDTVQSLAKSYKCEKIIVLADGGQSSYRKELSPEYKGNREALKAKQTEQEAQAFIDFLNEFSNTLTLLEANNIPTFKYKGVEADDLAAFISRNFDKLPFSKAWLVSSDKDWDLLLTDKISRWSYVTRKDYTIENWGERYSFPQDLYVTFKCLLGDSGDNVKGVTGVGEKRAESLIAQYGDVFNILNSLPIKGTAKYIQELNASEEKLLLNVELMDLLTCCEDAIGAENCKDFMERLNEV